MGRVGTATAAAAAALGALLLTAPSASAKPAVHTVVIQQMKFGPAPTGVRAGDTIVWANKDMFRHTATARDKSFDVDLPAGATGRTVVGKAGTITFYCRFHPAMTGRVVVAK